MVLAWLVGSLADHCDPNDRPALVTKREVVKLILLNGAAIVTARKLYGNTILYDVTYSIDKNGVRISPPHN
jgi:hypothetical protein